MTKILDLKNSIVDLKKEEFKLKKDSLKLIKQKEKIVKKKLENLFLEAIREITWRIEISDGRIHFFHNKEWIQKVKLTKTKMANKPRSMGASMANGYSIKQSKAHKIRVGNANSKDSVYKTKFGKLFRFLEDEFDSSIIKYNGIHITLTYEGFIIPISFSEAFSTDDIEQNLNVLNDFIAKTRMRLNLEAFNADTEILESELEIRKKFLHKNSNAFLFGL